jgi:HlyD family secretion protein
MTRKRRIGPWLIGAFCALVIATTLFIAIRKPPVQVDLAGATRGPMTVTIDDEGETRVRDMFVVSAPLAGRLLRVDLEAGDPVTREQTVVARLLPVDPAFLDTRSQTEAGAHARALAAQLASSQARVTQARAEQALADRELLRFTDLYRKGFAAQSAMDAARMRHDRAEAALLEAQSAVGAARFQLRAAQAALISPADAGRGGGRGIAVRAPVSGTVLRVAQESEAVVSAGTPLVEIGDPSGLEIVTDLLSADAVQIRPGAEVDIDNWGGNRPLKGKVRLVEPSGFTKVSALGVEEQRVNVRIDIAEPRANWARLGHGYRVIVRIHLWSAPNVLRVPISALFREGNRWATFVARNGRARLILVDVGHMNSEQAEIRAGLAPGDEVVLHPGDKIADEVRIEQRRS